MKNLLNFVLKQKLAIYIMTIIIMVFGFYSATKMKMESLPNVDIPYLIVTTVYPGGTPEQINEEITTPLEKRLESMDGLLNIDSQSMNNVSLMILEYEYGTDLVTSKNTLQKELEKLDLDEKIQEPSILEISLDSMPVSTVSVTSDKYSTEELSNYIEKELKPDLEEIKGASEIQVNGLQQQEIQLTFNEELLKNYNLTNEQLLEIVKANNVNMSIGILEFKNAKEAVSVIGEKTTLEDLENALLPFPSQNGGFMKLKDFASFEQVVLDNGVSRVNGKDSLTISLIKAQEGNTVEVVKEMNKIIDEFKSDYKDVEFVTILDQAEPIETSVHTMLSKALFGALAAIVIIMVFLRDTRSTLISVVSIPLSLLMAIAVLHQVGVTLNTMTLAAMTVAIGRVIDDSIVVVENIYRRLSDGNEKLSGRKLISAATIQMFMPILSSTLVTIAVFLPLMLVGGMVGEIFMPFALGMMFSLLASLLVAVTVVPALAHSLFNKELYGKKKLKKHKESSKITMLYEKGLIYTLNHKLITIVVSFILVGASLFGLTQVKFGFLPTEVASEWTLTYTPSNEELDKDIEETLTKTESLLMDNKNIQKVQATYSKSDSTDMMSLMQGGSSASVTVSFKDKVDLDKEKESILKELQSLESKGSWEDSMAAAMSMNTNQVSYSVYGETLEDIQKVVTPFTKELSKVKSLKDVDSDLNEVYKENQFLVNEEKLAENGLTTAQVGMVLYNFAQDTVVTTVKENNKDLNVVIKAKEQKTDTVDDLLNRIVGLNPVTQQPVFVKDVVSIEEGTTVNSVVKNNGYLVATVTATIIGDDIASVGKEIQKVIDKTELPLGSSISTGGVTEQMTDAFTQLGLAMLAAIAIIYLVLVLTFREGLAPFVILFSLPMTIIGVVIALLITGVTLDISGMLGILMLIGIVVTNAIVLIDRVLENEYSGLTIRDALLEAGKTRLRPILMTAIATVGAMIPLAIGAEGGGLISQGLGIIVIGGLFSSTILTLFIVPVIYELLSKIMKKDRKNINWD